MAYSYNTYTGNGSTTQYNISWTYIDSTHVKCYLDGVATTAFSVSSSVITFDTAPTAGVVIRIERETPIDNRLVDFQDGSVLSEADLDRSADQNFYVAQEITDDSVNKITLDTDDKFDAQSKVIKNVANPVNTNDAVNKTYLENTWLSSANKTALTTVNSNIANINAVNSNSTNINTVAGDATDIATVATNIGSVNTVATDITKVIAVANDLAEAVSEIETVADDLNEASSEIDVVANNITNVNTVGGISANVSTVAGISANVTTVAGNNTNINTVAGISGDVTSVAGIASDVSAVENIASNVTSVAGVASNVTTVAGISSDVTAVANIASDVSAVENIASNVTTVAGNNTNISTVAGANTNITAVAGAVANVNTVGGSIANVNTVATNISSVDNFAEKYRISASAPTTSLDVGDLYFDTSANELKVYKSSGWASAGSTVNGTSARYTYNITGTPSSVTGADANSLTLAYDAGFADVYVNGVRMSSADITITSGTSVVFASALADGDVVDVVAYGTFNVATVDASNINSGTLNIARLADGSITNAKLATPFVLTAPTISGIAPDAITNSATNIVITGTNYVITPNVEIISTTGAIFYPNTVTRNSSSQLTINATLATDGTYFIRIENPDGIAVRSSTALLNVSDAPTFSTASGSLGSLAQGGTASFDVDATSDSTVAFSVTSGALPSGLSLNSSSGAITGTENSSITSETTYNFTITATDAESQTADRAFTITVTVAINNGIQFN